MILMIMIVVPVTAHAEVKKVIDRSIVTDFGVASMTKTPDGSIVAVGEREYDAVIAKYNIDGTKVWETLYNPIQNEIWFVNRFDYVMTTDDGGYLAFNLYYSDSSSSQGNVFVKYDADGNMLWEKKNSQWAVTIETVTTSKEILATYYSENIIKFNLLGEILLFKSNDHSYIYSLIETKDGGFAAAGFNVTKYDSEGNELWFKNYRSELDWPRLNLVETKDGNLVVVDSENYRIIMYDINGNELMRKQVDGFELYADKAIALPDGYLVGGKDYNDNFSWVGKYDLDWNLVWKKTGDYLNIESLTQTSDGGYELLGINTQDHKCSIIKYQETHKINLGGTKNGTIISNLEEAYYGDEVTLTITPENGYEVGNVKVIDADGNEIEIVDGKFVMPGSEVTVNVEFTYPEVIPNPQTAVVSIIVLMIIIIGMFATVYIMVNREKQMIN